MYGAACRAYSCLSVHTSKVFVSTSAFVVFLFTHEPTAFLGSVDSNSKKLVIFLDYACSTVDSQHWCLTKHDAFCS